jgi:integrase
MGYCRSPRQRQTHPHDRGAGLGQAGHRRLDGSREDRGDRLLLPVSKAGKLNGEGLSDWAVWSVVEQAAKPIGIEQFGAHDLRRTCAKLCRKAGGAHEQIKFLLGHSSIQPRNGISGPNRRSPSWYFVRSAWSDC